MFIEKTDLVKAIRLEEINQITRNDDLTVTHCIESGVAEIKGYLTKHFDIDAIFSATGNSRDMLIVQFAIDIAIYNLIATQPPGQDTEDRYERYKRAINWLKGVRDGEILSNLPLATPENEISTRGYYNAPTKRNNDY
jgi:phage gp36-like protein